MQTDNWGRQFLTGQEQGPTDLRCLKCNRTPYLVGNPYGTTVFEFSRADAPHDISAFALCDECAIGLWEHLTPEIATNPAYIAKKDQHMAAIPQFREHWNSEACPEEQIPT